MSQNKKAIPMTGEAQAQAARLFGRHVSREKAFILFAVTMIACALPSSTGVRLWESIPEIVETGITRMDGRDDSMPRALVVFGIPGLMCLLNLIVHIQLYLNQQRMTLPKTFVRLFGRWGFPVLSTGLANLFIYRAANQPLPPPFAASCGIGLALLLLGGHMMDCPQTSTVALHFSFLEADCRVWAAVHRLAACLWMAAGLGVLIFASVTGRASAFFAAAVPAAFAAPVLYGKVLCR